MPTTSSPYSRKHLNDMGLIHKHPYSMDLLHLIQCAKPAGARASRRGPHNTAVCLIYIVSYALHCASTLAHYYSDSSLHASRMPVSGHPGQYPRKSHTWHEHLGLPRPPVAHPPIPITSKNVLNWVQAAIDHMGSHAA
jgi:hypothetical protein